MFPFYNAYIPLPSNFHFADEFYELSSAWEKEDAAYVMANAAAQNVMGPAFRQPDLLEGSLSYPNSTTFPQPHPNVLRPDPVAEVRRYLRSSKVNLLRNNDSSYRLSSQPRLINRPTYSSSTSWSRLRRDFSHNFYEKNSFSQGVDYWLEVQKILDEPSDGAIGTAILRDLEAADVEQHDVSGNITTSLFFDEFEDISDERRKNDVIFEDISTQIDKASIRIDQQLTLLDHMENQARAEMDKLAKLVATL